MSEAHVFALGLALACLAGVRAYLTVFGVGIAGLMGWVDLPAALEVTTSPWVLGTAGALALVEFFARSKGSSRIIRLLAARQRPVRYRAFVDDFRFDEKWRRDSDELPASAIPAVLGIMQLAGLVRITRHGLSITEVGREVRRRPGRNR